MSQGSDVLKPQVISSRSFVLQLSQDLMALKVFARLTQEDC